MLFSSPSDWRGLQNLGGIGNITVVPPRGQIEGVRAFDTGPGVAVIDGVARALRPDLPYDVDGKMARAGRPNGQVVKELLAHPYFSMEPPKSTGRELFNSDYVQKLISTSRSLGAIWETSPALAAFRGEAWMPDPCKSCDRRAMPRPESPL